VWHGHSVWSCIHSSNLLRRGVWLPAVNNLCRSFLSSVVLLSVTYFPFIRSLSRCILFLTLVASPSLFTRLRQCFYKCLRITTKSRLTRLTAITELTVHESSQVQQTEGWQTLAPRARFASAANKRSRVCPGTACVVFTHWQTLCAYMTSSTILEVHDIQHCHQRRTEPRQWLKYKFSGPGALKKFGPLLSAEGALRNLFVPLTPAWGPGMASPAFLLTLTTEPRTQITHVQKI